MEAIRLNCNMHLAKIDYTQIHSPFTEIYCRRLYSWAIILSLLFQCGYNCGLTPQKKNLNRRPTLQLRIGANIFLLLKSEGSLCYSTPWRSHCSPSLSFTKKVKALVLPLFWALLCDFALIWFCVEVHVVPCSPSPSLVGVFPPVQGSMETSCTAQSLCTHLLQKGVLDHILLWIAYLSDDFTVRKNKLGKSLHDVSEENILIKISGNNWLAKLEEANDHLKSPTVLLCLGLVLYTTIITSRKCKPPQIF